MTYSYKKSRDPNMKVTGLLEPSLGLRAGFLPKNALKSAIFGGVIIRNHMQWTIASCIMGHNSRL